MFTLTLLLSLAPLTPSAPPADIRTEFVDMGETVINGEIRRPQGTWSDARQAARFNKLLRLKKSFLPTIVASGEQLLHR